MDIGEITRKLRDLQIEQNALLEQLNNHHKNKNISVTTRENDYNTIRVGDQVILGTGGVRCTTGDIATVTKINKSTIHFKVNRNGHHSHKKIKNIRKISK